MSVPDNEVVASLTFGGQTVGDYFLVGGLICHVSAEGNLMAWAIDDPQLAAATAAYLRRHGAHEYPSVLAYLERGRA